MQSSSIVQEQFIHQFPENVLELNSDDNNNEEIALNDAAKEIYNSNSEALQTFGIDDRVINDAYFLFQLSLYKKFY